MLLWPHDLWPKGFQPLGLYPDDARRYEVMRYVAGGNDVLVAAVAPGTQEQLITGADNSDEQYYVRARNRINLADRDPIQPDLRRIAFDDDGDLILPPPGPCRNLQLIALAGGEVKAQWTQDSATRFGQPAAVAFNFYVATGATPIDFDTVTTTSTSTGRPRSQSLGTFADATTVRCVVRAVSAQGVEETNTVEASVVADASAPDAVTALTLEVTPG